MLPFCPRAYNDLLALALDWFCAVLGDSDGMHEVFRLYTDVDDIRMHVRESGWCLEPSIMR